MPLPSSLALLPRLARAALAGLAASVVAQTAHCQTQAEVAYNYGEIETPRSTAVSGAMRATSTSTTALFANPANMALTQVYHVSAFAQMFPEGNRQVLGAAVVDSLLSSVGIAGGLSAAWSQQEPGSLGRQFTDLRFGLALPIPEVLYVGVSGRYLILDQTGVGPLGASYASGGLQGQKMFETITMDVGVTLRPIKELVIGLVGQNLTSPDTSLVPLLGGIGVGFLSSEISFGGDIVFEATTFNDLRLRGQGGLEVLVAERVPLRGGYRYDQGMDSHAVSFGIGYTDPRFSIDAGIRRSIYGAEYTAVTVGFGVHLETMTLGQGISD